jgi:tRNA threonylcarbamoyladenosine biosynthesis protein TsaE
MNAWPDTVISRSPEETRDLARRLAEQLEDGTVMALHGDLGAGKTCLVQGLAEALGIEDVVNSPTYTIVNELRGKRRLYHIDLYRVSDDLEAMALGLEEYLEPDGITAIEWAERATDSLPADAVHIHIEPGATANERSIRIHRGPSR